MGTSNVITLKVIRDRKKISRTVCSAIDAEQLARTVAINRNRSTCCGCGANVQMETDPCPGCKTNFRYVVYGNVGGGNNQEQIDQICSEAFGLKQLGTYRGTPVTASFELIRSK